MTTQTQRPSIDKGMFGLILFLAAESMTFAGLISANMILRAGQSTWPPPDQPRLAWGATAVASSALLIGFAIMAVAHTRHRHGRSWRRLLATTTFLGFGFLTIQVFEWLRLIRYGLTVTSSLYGALFYLIIGFHALHVTAGLVFMTVALVRSVWLGHYQGVRLASVYWAYVVILWPPLYVTVYLL